MLPRPSAASLPDVVMFAAGLALFYGTVEIARNWLGPFHPQVEISRSLGALPVYAAYSLLRIALAYVLSLIFALAYGYIAAYNARAERFMIPLLDVLQSIPVLSFLPGVMLAMAALFPGRQLGVELGAVLLIFTGQVWNIAFSFYASLKSIPREMREAAAIYRFNRWQRFLEDGIALRDDWARLEFHDVGGGRVVFSDGLRTVQRFPVAGPWLLSPDGSGRWRHAIHSAGHPHDDRGDRAHRSAGVATGDRLGGKIQNGAGGERERAEFMGSRFFAALAWHGLSA